MLHTGQKRFHANTEFEMNLNDELKFISNVFDINSFDWGAFLIRR